MVRVVPQNNSKALRKQSIKVAQRSALYLAIGRHIGRLCHGADEGWFVAGAAACL